MKELRDKQVSARIKPRAKRIIENSKYSYADAIEYFAFEVIGKKEDKKERLKRLKLQNKTMAYEMSRNEMEINDLAKELGIKADDDLLFADEIKNSVRYAVRWFKKEKSTYKTIENFLDLKRKALMVYANECDLEWEDFMERVISEYNSKNEE